MNKEIKTVILCAAFIVVTYLIGEGIIDIAKAIQSVLS